MRYIAESVCGFLHRNWGKLREECPRENKLTMKRNNGSEHDGQEQTRVGGT